MKNLVENIISRLLENWQKAADKERDRIFRQMAGVSDEEEEVAPADKTQDRIFKHMFGVSDKGKEIDPEPESEDLSTTLLRQLYSDGLDEDKVVKEGRLADLFKKDPNTSFKRAFSILSNINEKMSDAKNNSERKKVWNRSRHDYQEVKEMMGWESFGKLKSNHQKRMKRMVAELEELAAILQRHNEPERKKRKYPSQAHKDWDEQAKTGKLWSPDRKTWDYTP
jgi:hypothetical protein